MGVVPPHHGHAGGLHQAAADPAQFGRNGSSRQGRQLPHDGEPQIVLQPGCLPSTPALHLQDRRGLTARGLGFLFVIFFLGKGKAGGSGQTEDGARGEKHRQNNVGEAAFAEQLVR